MPKKKQKFLYADYVKKLAQRFKSNFEEIVAVQNTEYGVEFELCLCKALRPILPDRFGVCRGWVVTRDGRQAGDDVIIYDRAAFPTLRLLDQNEYIAKQHIPVEAVYAYIEAKHCLHTQGKGNQSFHKASCQVAAVKELRPADVDWGSQPWPIAGKFPAAVPRGWPKKANPIFGAIFARQVREKKGKRLLSSSSVVEQIHGIHVQPDPPFSPDLIVVGDGVVVVPGLKDRDELASPFFIEGVSQLMAYEVPGLAFAIGLQSMMFAMSVMRLGPMPWVEMMADSLGIEAVKASERES